MSGQDGKGPGRVGSQCVRQKDKVRREEDTPGWPLRGRTQFATKFLFTQLVHNKVISDFPEPPQSEVGGGLTLAAMRPFKFQGKLAIYCTTSASRFPSNRRTFSTHLLRPI
ncbi:hypothetical protein PoB_003048700 [Plakobranchus ocellatus]|uniref:Uncharacterized protein n=1 Tax=Plakobranchus ocellatus TaxID=259542 RepID=A0AAV4A9V6_9GAST|nr:hypothetical protein PoB_003048700 [Plakobranchus ocellatus]